MSLQSPGQLAQFAWDYDRRRRLLADEYAGSSATSVGPATRPPQYRSRNYGNALFLEDQMRLTDLLPQRLSVVGAIWLVSTAVIAALMCGYAQLTHLPDWVAAPLDLSQSSSLPGWFSTIMLTAAAVLAMLVYYVRRHRLDDYQGRYRVWLWAAGCLLLVSVDQAAGLHRAVQTLLSTATGTPLLGDGQIWWILPYGFLLGAIGARLLVDVWESRLATAALSMAAFCYAVALAARLQAIHIPDKIQQALVLHGAQLVGNLMVLMTILLYGRHVMLDATGQLPAGSAEEDSSELADCQQTDHSTAARLAQVRVHPPHSGCSGPHSSFSARSVARPTTAVTTVPAPAAGAASGNFPPPNNVSSSPSGGSMGAAASAPHDVSGSSAAAIQAAEASVRRKLTKEEKKALRRRLEMERLKRLQQGASG